MSINEETKLIYAKAAQGAGQTSFVSDTIDMAQDDGFDGVRFIITALTIAGAATPSLIVQTASDSGFTSDVYDVTDGTLALVTGDSDEVCAVDVLHPPQRYVRLFVDRDAVAADSAFGATIAELYRAREAPTVYASTDAYNGLKVINKTSSSTTSTV
jgi:hypothetical protein